MATAPLNIHAIGIGAATAYAVKRQAAQGKFRLAAEVRA